MRNNTKLCCLIASVDISIKLLFIEINFADCRQNVKILITPISVSSKICTRLVYAFVE
jgi:hypothetical protein